jgi:hypothetical protein
MHSREELLKWQAIYKEKANNEELSDEERMHAIGRLTDIAYALENA